MDSPRGRVYQMVQVANGAAITPSYIEHIDLCLACRGCESACPSGVRYGRMVEDARAEIEAEFRRLSVLVEKTGSGQEHEAFAFLRHYVERWGTGERPA